MAQYSRQSFIRGAKMFDSMFLDMNQVPILRPSVNDEVYTIEEDYNERPDLLAQKLYEGTEINGETTGYFLTHSIFSKIF